MSDKVSLTFSLPFVPGRCPARVGLLNKKQIVFVFTHNIFVRSLVFSNNTRNSRTAAQTLLTDAVPVSTTVGWRRGAVREDAHTLTRSP